MPSKHTSTNSNRKNSGVSSSGGRRQVPAEANIDIIKTKLLAALKCQMSFGSAAGTTIVFYAGNCAYTLFELQGNYGQVLVYDIPLRNVLLIIAAIFHINWLSV